MKFIVVHPFGDICGIIGVIIGHAVWARHRNSQIIPDIILESVFHTSRACQIASLAYLRGHREGMSRAIGTLIDKSFEEVIPQVIWVDE